MTRRPPNLTGPGWSRRFTSIDRPAETVTGPWQAWRLAVSDDEQRRAPAGLCLWFLHAPGSHPIWQWHAVTAIHLRALDGHPPATLRFPGASHEFIVGALDPDWDPDVEQAVGWNRNLLRPCNLVHQVSGITDEMATELAHLLVRAFCNGLSSPDDDYANRNIQMITATADHLRRGMHLPS